MSLIQLKIGERVLTSLLCVIRDIRTEEHGQLAMVSKNFAKIFLELNLINKLQCYWKKSTSRN